jgi:hypothetical protein
MKFGPIMNTRRRVRRNEPCPFCASGIKFKRCHGAPQVVEIPPEERPFPGYTGRIGKGPRPAMREQLS